MSGIVPEPSDHTASALSRDEAVAVLERFVVDNDELRELEAQIGRFNVFDALGVVRAEIRHSTFLRWLLDPNESHGQGALFLRAVLMDVLRSTPAELRPLSPIDLDGVELRGVDVRTEWNRVDVLITCDEPAFVVAIENKIDSGEHSEQLSRYHDAVTRHFGDRRALYVFLTREGDEPSESNWTPYSYRQLHGVLERVGRTSEGAIGDDVRVFVDHYVSLLRSRFMDDPVIDDLVAKIYKQHRQALDIIFEKRGDPRKRIAQAFADALEQSEFEWTYHVHGYACGFLPTEWVSFLPPVAKHMGWCKQALVFGRFDVRPERIEWSLNVSPSHDPEMRAELIDAIKTRGEEYGLRPTGSGTQWNRIRQKKVFRPSGDLTDDEAALAWIEKAAREAEKACIQATPLLRDHFAP